MQKIVCDTNSIIYLAKCGLLRLFVQGRTLVLPGTVVQECMMDPRSHPVDVALIQELIAQERVQVIEEEAGVIEPLARLDPGERSVILIYRRIDANMVLTDDGGAVKYCKQFSIPFLSSPYVPSILYEEGCITLQEALKGIKTLGRIGYFSRTVLSMSLKKLLTSNRLKGLLFDMDGVLVDSMHLHDEAWRKTLLSIGLQITKEEIYLREGEKGTVTAQDMLVKAGRDPSFSAIHQLLKEKERIFKEGARPHSYPEALPCIRAFQKKGYRLALVTGSSMADLQSSLDPRLHGLFHAVVTSDSVQKGKPHPEPYLSALDKLKAEAAEVLVIENALYGIQAAHAAGLACVALTTSLAAEHLESADLILSNLNELMELFN